MEASWKSHQMKPCRPRRTYPASETAAVTPTTKRVIQENIISLRRIFPLALRQAKSCQIKNSTSTGGSTRLTKRLGMNMILNEMTISPRRMIGAYTYRVSFISSGSRRIRKDMRIAATSHAKTMIRLDASTKKLLSIMLDPITIAIENIKTPERSVMHGIRFLKSGSRKRGTQRLRRNMASRETNVATMMKKRTNVEKPTTTGPRHSLLRRVLLSFALEAEPYLALTSANAMVEYNLNCFRTLK